MDRSGPSRVYSASRGAERYLVTVVDYRGIGTLGTERSKACPPGARSRPVRTTFCPSARERLEETAVADGAGNSAVYFSPGFTTSSSES